jgi:hypothetical protein
MPGNGWWFTGKIHQRVCDKPQLSEGRSTQLPEILALMCALDARMRQSRILKTGRPFTGLVGSNPTLCARINYLAERCYAA